MESATQTNGITLMPCPFCGKEPTLAKYKHGYTIDHVCTFVDPTWFPTRELAISAWNARAERTCHDQFGSIYRKGFIDGAVKTYEAVERTCELERAFHWDNACMDYWEHELSCGHAVETLDKEPPNFCPECGAKVKEESR